MAETTEQARAIEAAFEKCRAALADCATAIEAVRADLYGPTPAIWVDGENDWWYRHDDGLYYSRPTGPGRHGVELATLQAQYPRRGFN